MLTFLPMQEVENKGEAQENGELKAYEASFLILPSLAEENLPEIFSNLKSAVERAGGLFISDDFPKLRPLAYTIVSKEEGKGQKYNQAYFGWFKFELEKDKIREVEESLKKDKKVLRYLLIETVKENTLYAHKLLTKKTREKSTRKTDEGGAPIEVTPTEEIDKSIEKLVIS